MRFDLVDLQLFIAVADQRSITAGAERSHLALASASARIKGLEDALGVALLKRGRRGVELTAAGESLLDHARLVIHQIDAMRGDLAGFASGLRASVHFLANTSGLSEHLPKALAGFLRAQITSLRLAQASRRRTMASGMVLAQRRAAASGTRATPTSAATIWQIASKSRRRARKCGRRPSRAACFEMCTCSAVALVRPTKSQAPAS